MGPEAAPGTTPEAAPGTTPATTPGAAPGTTPEEKAELEKINTPAKAIPGISEEITKLASPLHIYSARTVHNNNPLKRPDEIGHIAKNVVETDHAINLMNEFTKINKLQD